MSKMTKLEALLILTEHPQLVQCWDGWGDGKGIIYFTNKQYQELQYIALASDE